ncbi:MAG: SRPBCC family protein [Halodesulfurarchaeum sp.]
MESVTVKRPFTAPKSAVREVILGDISAFVRASGFDRVHVEGGSYSVSRDIGFATFELTLDRVESESLLAFEQTEGIFDRMWTEYRLERTEQGCEAIATTEFTLGGVLAPVLDGTMIKSQRKREFELQFDHVESALQEAKPA